VHTLFLTGSSGFLGRHLVPALAAAGAKKIFCLSRTQPALELHAGHAAEIAAIRGSLFDTLLYERELAESDAVIHLAAATGKAPPGEHFRTNRDGTRALVEACRQIGGKQFLFVSSIAVNFPDKRRYPYAQAKEQAEGIVRESGLRYTIARPTMIFGAGAPVLAGLARLAALPVTPVFGDGTTRVQPVDAGDLAAMLSAMVARGQFGGETLELGGPEPLPIGELLARMRERLRPGPRRMMRIPLAPVLLALAPLEKIVYEHLPFTTGQLGTFRFDGTAAKNALWEEFRPKMKDVRAMLAALAAHDDR
jgi:NADH dehydrogenase